MSDASTSISSEGMTSEDESMTGTWISWFCTLRGHEFFCEITKEWIEDGFNLYGLRQEIGPRYDDCLSLILDRFSHGATSDKLVMQDACLLYGHIHSRYILTSCGLQAMKHKFNMQDFGRCPRFMCHSQPVVPIGLSDRVCQEHVKVYCARCKQIYEPVYPGVQSVDGAFFGTTFPHLFFMSFEQLRPKDCDGENWVPRVYGFRIHGSSQLGPQGSEQPQPHQHDGKAANKNTGRNQAQPHPRPNPKNQSHGRGIDAQVSQRPLVSLASTAVHAAHPHTTALASNASANVLMVNQQVPGLSTAPALAVPAVSSATIAMAPHAHYYPVAAGVSAAATTASHVNPHTTGSTSATSSSSLGGSSSGDHHHQQHHHHPAVAATTAPFLATPVETAFINSTHGLPASHIGVGMGVKGAAGGSGSRSGSGSGSGAEPTFAGDPTKRRRFSEHAGTAVPMPVALRAVEHPGGGFFAPGHQGQVGPAGASGEDGFEAPDTSERPTSSGGSRHSLQRWPTCGSATGKAGTEHTYLALPPGAASVQAVEVPFSFEARLRRGSTAVPTSGSASKRHKA